MKKAIKKYYETATENTIDGVYFVDRRRKILYWNKAAEEITGYKKEEIINKRCFDNILRHVDDNGTLLCQTKCPLVKAMEKGEIVSENVYLHDKNGARIPIYVEAIPVKNRKGEVVGAVERFNQSWGLSLVRENIQKLQKDAYIDPLTQIPNRRYLEKKIEEAIKEVNALKRTNGFLFLDIDNFKRLNDTFGHFVGDRVLRAIAQTILSNIKPQDTVGRYGGEEFAVILKDINEENLRKFTNTLRILIGNSSVDFDGSEISATVSIGCTLIKETDTVESLIKRADTLMYEAKKKGKNTCVFG
ncbi:diguanylate cyclase domain-containing protein [Caldisericum exile]|uniref:Signaling protein n=1 Tax=Caldisericum exile (strain DSM 21853 / NBRC 104410 / AZM16c01) TaxID=511051 RepID=A0A7U6JGM0_CALEA|nr:diguanylate cyclase [Caldisericum exile]BAL80437.1 putative signaling protein [Caldisericum exile AZM16c01]